MSQDSSLQDSELLHTLRSGRCVLVMRHTSIAVPRKDRFESDVTEPAHEPQLDEQGRHCARNIGEAICHLRVPIGEVFSSPRSRARDTARLAGFPQHETRIQLDDANDADVLGVWLRGKVAGVPVGGTNILIVTHLANILGAFGDRVTEVTPGEVLVFQPDYSIRATLLTCIRSEQWRGLIKLASVANGAPRPVTVWV